MNIKNNYLKLKENLVKMWCSLEIYGKNDKIGGYCFAFEHYEGYQKYSTNRVSSFLVKGKLVQSDKHISSLNSWYSYEIINGDQSSEEILNLLQNNHKKISSLRANPIISYLTNVEHPLRKGIDISKEDIDNINNLILLVDKKITEVDVILYSLGGDVLVSRVLVDMLRKRFEKVNFLVPFEALSAASMICLSGDEIIMTPEASLSPFDVQIKSPASNNYSPVNIMLKCAKGARFALNPLNILYLKSTYQGWDMQMAQNTINFCNISIKNTKHFPMYWLMKYTFRAFITKNEKFNRYLLLPFWKIFTKNGRKANKIVNFFIDTGIKFGHDVPILYSDIEHSGLNILEAKEELLELLRENSLLSKRLFERSSLLKIYSNSDSSFVIFNKSKDTSDIKL